MTGQMYKYIYQEKENFEEKDIYTPNHYLNATELAKGFGICYMSEQPNLRIFKKVLDDKLKLFPKHYYLTSKKKKMRVYTPMDVKYFITYFFHNLEGPFYKDNITFYILDKQELRLKTFSMFAQALG